MKTEKRTCKKCNSEKNIKHFCLMINKNKGYECKTCRSVYISSYYALNKARIRANETLRRKRAKKNKTER